MDGTSERPGTRRRRRRARPASADPMAIVDRLSAIRDRRPGTDAERRAARVLAGELRDLGRPVSVQTVWLRMEWAIALAAGGAVALAGSLVSLTAPEAGLALALVALVGIVLDLGGRWPGFRLLTPTRATQNVVSPAPEDRDVPVRLILTAATDVPRAAGYRRLDTWLGGRGSLLLLAAVVGVAVVAGLRADGVDARALDFVQLVPTLLLLVLVAALLETRRATSLTGTNAASAPALVIALASRLTDRPPRHLAVDVVLAGAQDSGGALGLAHHLRTLEPRLGRDEVAIVHVEPCGVGTPIWWRGDGLLLGVDSHPQLVGAAQGVAEAEAHLQAQAFRGRGATGVLPARRRRWPAIAIGGWTPSEPAAQAVEPEDLSTALAFASALVARVDADVGRRLADEG